MLSDPWLTAEGTPHSAAEWMGLPEWVGCESEDEGVLYRLAREPGMWRVQWDSPASGWAGDHYITAHEAAALLEKAAREWLRAKDISVREVGGGWVACYWPRETYLCKDGTWGSEIKLRLFPTYTAVLQAGILAA